MKAIEPIKIDSEDSVFSPIGLICLFLIFCVVFLLGSIPEDPGAQAATLAVSFAVSMIALCATNSIWQGHYNVRFLRSREYRVVQMELDTGQIDFTVEVRTLFPFGWNRWTTAKGHVYAEFEQANTILQTLKNLESEKLAEEKLKFGYGTRVEILHVKGGD